MGETSNIAAIAEIVSAKLFSHFGWERVGSQNINWECVDSDHKEKTHPADAVYQYDEPYENITTYILCDFKSYAKESITSRKIKDALISLNRAVSCAKKSPDWYEKFCATTKNYTIKGMLFIWNHDGDFDSDFGSILKDATKNIKIDKGNVICVLGPDRLKYLCNVTQNITQLRGDESLPAKNRCGFFYPELAKKRLLSSPSRLPLTIESMSSSYQIMRYEGDDGKIEGFDIYSSDTGESKEYFMHLFDYMRHNNLLQENKKIRIFMPFADREAHSRMRNARVQYASDVDEDEKEKLKNSISYKHIPNIMTSFYPHEIGARDNHE
ncbi:hypothetical protein [Nitratidesulfovibrio vulgaris]|uniref:hypothetical protein n=1 Tax=Nitratidesulfovibrio vulgaris TaxID=881 RepID=UPI002300D9E5|nr:hypothetical protein [Nitratidesulfovibrio vulgaris]WCB45064.1 hypothetical protein PH214_08135 [Nitratidesulfovibrio vulgaris]